MNPNKKIWHCHKLEVALLRIWEENLKRNSPRAKIITNTSSRIIKTNSISFQYFKDWVDVCLQESFYCGNFFCNSTFTWKSASSPPIIEFDCSILVDESFRPIHHQYQHHHLWLPNSTFKNYNNQFIISISITTSGFQMAWTSFGSARSSGSWKILNKLNEMATATAELKYQAQSLQNFHQRGNWIPKVVTAVKLNSIFSIQFLLPHIWTVKQNEKGQF